MFTLKNLLSGLNDEELIYLVKDNNSDAFVEICARYENIFYKVCQKYIPTISACGVNANDILQEKTFILFHCVKSFNPKKGAKLSTWIGNYARYLCLNTITSRKFIAPTLEEDRNSIIENISAESYEDKALSEEDYNQVINIINNIDDKRINEIFKYRYTDKKMSWSKIAEKMNMSTQTSINLHKKGIKFIKNKLKS